ncbi:MAG: hypothetical protein AB1422_01775 [bacterium]
MPISLIKEEERHILRVLPILLKRDEQLRGSLYAILSETFATKVDLKLIIEQMNKRFEEQREETNRRFEEINRRFEEHREETNKRFEAMERRFEEHREETNKRFEEINRRFEEHREETNKRFEQIDKRFEQIDKRFEQIDRRFDVMDRKLEDQSDWVGVVVGGLQRRAGRNLEDTIAGTLRCVLKTPDLKPEYLMMRKKITDEEGIMGRKGKSYEIDLYVHNSYALVFEIKSYAEADDVERFNDKAEIAKKQFNIPQAKKVFVTLQKERDMAEVCKTFGIELV